MLRSPPYRHIGERGSAENTQQAGARDEYHLNAGEQTATVYGRDKAIISRLDALVIEFPKVYRLIVETDIDKTYEMLKSSVIYRKPRRISEKHMKRI